jgi:hypothetical protein
MTGNPLLMLTVFCCLSGLQFASFGLLGELCTRLYYAQAGRRPYTVSKLTNFEDARPHVLRRAA